MSRQPVRSVAAFRATRTLSIAIESDPDPMVQQQLARLRFLEHVVGVRGQKILDWGCGTGFNCRYLTRSSQASRVLGFDLSQEAIKLAQASFEGITFLVGDACDPALQIDPGSWDRIICCEVLEHVADQEMFLVNLRRHLAEDGIAFLSTPNRRIFSLDHVPSPMNQEHVRELAYEELIALLNPHFSRVEVYGQRFVDRELLEAWKEDVRRKIEQCKQGTRWEAKDTLRKASPFQIDQPRL